MRHLKGRWGDGGMCGFERAKKGGEGGGSERSVINVLYIIEKLVASSQRKGE